MHLLSTTVSAAGPINISNMQEPVFSELTSEILHRLDPHGILYAEVTPPGAMGNAGGVMLYAYRDGKIYYYETNYYRDQPLFLEAEQLLLRHEATTKQDVARAVFEVLYGGMGNLAFVNRQVKLEVGADHLVYLIDGRAYKVHCSVQGIFLSVADRIRRR